MIKPILVITDRSDLHADYVAMELRKIGGDIVRMNTADMANNSDFFVEKLSPEEPWKLKLYFKDSDKTVTADSFDTIWYRKPEPVKPSSSLQKNTGRFL